MRGGLTPDEMITKSDHLDAINALRAEYLGRYMAAIREVERLRAMILNIQALAEKGFPIDPTKLATRCRLALGPEQQEDK